MSKKVAIAVVYNDGDRSNSDSWMVSIKVDGHQFNGAHLDKKEDAQKLATSVATALGVSEVEDARPLF